MFKVNESVYKQCGGTPRFSTGQNQSRKVVSAEQNLLKKKKLEKDKYWHNQARKVFILILWIQILQHTWLVNFNISLIKNNIQKMVRGEKLRLIKSKSIVDHRFFHILWSYLITSINGMKQKENTIYIPSKCPSKFWRKLSI